MTAAVKNEINALSSLLRRLCLQKTHVGPVSTRQRYLATACQWHITSHVPQTRTVSTVSSANPLAFWQNVVCIGSASGICFQQKRGYAKAPTAPKKPLSFDYSGDLMTQVPLDPHKLHADFKDIKLDSVSSSVQKLCTIEYASGDEKKKHRRIEVRERIMNIFGSDADREMRVAMLTVDIRNMIPHVLNLKKDKRSKAILVEKIQMRKKVLKQLRRTDYQRFLWLLQELRIRYVLPPLYYGRVTRKYRIKQAVWETANNLRLQKIADLKAQLAAEKAEFLEYKEKALAQIHQDAARYDLDLAALEKSLVRKRIVKTYPRIYTWEERQQMEKEAAMK